MYQQLLPKVGGDNLSQVVDATGQGENSSRHQSPTVCHDMLGLWNKISWYLVIQGQGEGAVLARGLPKKPPHPA